MMHRPKYVKEFFKIPFLMLGTIFLFEAALQWADILYLERETSGIQPSDISGILIFSVAIVLFIIWAVLKAFIVSEEKSCMELWKSGTKIIGTVEKVYLQTSIQYHGKSPYRILYTYAFQGKIHHHKSNLLWEKPNISAHDSIVVYADSSGKSTLSISLEQPYK